MYSSSVSPGCLNGWHGYKNSCFYIEAEKTVSSWATARTACLKHGTRLAVSQDVSTLGYLKTLAEGTKVGNWYAFYIGASATQNLKWRWTNGETVSSSAPWGPREPSGDGNCGTVIKPAGWSGWKLNDENCATRLGFVCEKIPCKLKVGHFM